MNELVSELFYRGQLVPAASTMNRNESKQIAIMDQNKYGIKSALLGLEVSDSKATKVGPSYGNTYHTAVALDSVQTMKKVGVELWDILLLSFYEGQ